ncbi:unnamed protein product [Pedinophyceae sp. YPF-701]|nr:unnamed protein product [Pedinophyceae sp. YPF-701]
MMMVSDDVIIDAKVKGSWARFLNSSCDPNCVTQKWTNTSDSETRVGIFAMEDIKKGEELTYNYMFEHFGALSGETVRCLCGSAKCGGTLDRKRGNNENVHARGKDLQPQPPRKVQKR